MLHTPGHSPGAVCFRVADLGLVFTGDTLFAGGPGATGRSFSDFPTIVESIRERLLTLPADTVVHTGHGDSTTIGAEAPHLPEWLDRVAPPAAADEPRCATATRAADEPDLAPTSPAPWSGSGRWRATPCSPGSRRTCPDALLGPGARVYGTPRPGRPGRAGGDLLDLVGRAAERPSGGAAPARPAPGDRPGLVPEPGA